MIPKTIHYCWFGGKTLSPLAQKCKKTWSLVFPDYTIIEWNESNVDLQQNDYVKFCYTHKLWAFLSDYIRLSIIYEHGGIYFDTDVEVVRYPQELLENSAWFGFESKDYINTGLGFAAEAHHPAVAAMMKIYESRTEEFLTEDYNNRGHLTGCPTLNTNALLQFGLQRSGEKQKVCDALILPIDYLCPLNDLTGVLHKTDNTVSIHWFSKSPQGKFAYWKSKFTRPFHRLISLFN